MFSSKLLPLIMLVFSVALFWLGASIEKKMKPSKIKTIIIYSLVAIFLGIVAIVGTGNIY